MNGATFLNDTASKRPCDRSEQWDAVNRKRSNPLYGSGLWEGWQDILSLHLVHCSPDGEDVSPPFVNARPPHPSTAASSSAGADCSDPLTFCKPHCLFANIFLKGSGSCTFLNLPSPDLCTHFYSSSAFVLFHPCFFQFGVKTALWPWRLRRLFCYGLFTCCWYHQLTLSLGFIEMLIYWLVIHVNKLLITTLWISNRKCVFLYLFNFSQQCIKYTF